MLDKKDFLSLLKNNSYIEKNGIFRCDIIENKTEKINRQCYNQIAPKFKKYWEKLENWQLKERKKFISYLKKNPVILDLGCGQGRDLEIFSNLGIHNLIGLDFSIGQLKLAKQRKVARLLNTSFDNLPFKNNSIDGIWSCVTLLHIEKKKIQSILIKMYEILKKQGMFFISLQEGIGKKVVKRDIYNKIPMVMYYYKPEEIKKLLKFAGFEILDYERYHVWKGIKDKERIFFNFYCRRK